MTTMQERPHPICRAIMPNGVDLGCGKHPEELPEYVDAASGSGLAPSDWVWAEEGTINERNGHFLCTMCYLKAGSPSVHVTQGRWVAP